MSHNVTNERRSGEGEVPVVITPAIEVHNEFDWDLEAGLTGAPEGNPRDYKRLKPIQYKAISLLLRVKLNQQLPRNSRITEDQSKVDAKGHSH